jgi:hypothetical protein
MVQVIAADPWPDLLVQGAVDAFDLALGLRVLGLKQARFLGS